MRTVLIVIGFLHAVHVVSKLTTSFTVTKTVKEEEKPAAEQAAE